MAQIVNRLDMTFFSLKKRVNLFYVLSFAPLILIAYYEVFGVVIAMYGFILLLIKKRDLSHRHEAGKIQTVLGLAIILGSFFVYYALDPFFRSVAFYGRANYVAYIFGLFLMFFDISALREAFTPLFLIVAATSSSFISRWLEPHLTPYIPHFVSLIAAILRTLGVGVKTYHPNFIELQTSKGSILTEFVWGCVGVYSILIFSIILVIVLFEEPTRLKTRILWSVIGILGTLFVNIIRITIIYLADYFYGFEVGGQVHYFIGYALFITWLAIFFYTFSKRHAILGKVQSVKQKLFRVDDYRQQVSP